LRNEEFFAAAFTIFNHTVIQGHMTCVHMSLHRTRIPLYTSRRTDSAIRSQPCETPQSPRLRLRRGRLPLSRLRIVSLRWVCTIRSMMWTSMPPHAVRHYADHRIHHRP